MNDPAGAKPREKLGLALSGGGFRAAFFHLGVLARMAELGTLKDVEVLSTVSGGSVIGAAYYLKLKGILEASPEGEEPDDADYVRIVIELDAAFRSAVSEGIRGRVLSNWAKNLQMLLPFSIRGRSYSRTDRIGDLFDRYIYKSLFGDVGKRDDDPFSRDRQVEMRQLLIRPGGQLPEGSLDEVNPGRDAKIPALVINATALNTGHAWRFEASRMGEQYNPAMPPGIDGNRVLAPGDFVVADRPLEPGLFAVPGPQQDFPLGLAVAASAAVPGVFHPLGVSDFYKDALIQLADGGVYDNQGIQALIDHDCTDMVVSDGSHQMDDLAKPSPFLPAVVGRTTSILSDRVRDLRLSGQPATTAVLHLREGLIPKVLEPDQAWDDATPWPGDAPVSSADPEVVEALAQIRTDLDSFSKREIDALACWGYMCADDKQADLATGAQIDSFHEWSFEYIQPQLEGGDTDNADLIEHLQLGSRRFFRWLYPLEPFLKYARPVLLVFLLWALMAAVVVAVVDDPVRALAIIGLLIAAVLLLTLLPVAWSYLLRLVRGK